MKLRSFLFAASFLIATASLAVPNPETADEERRAVAQSSAEHVLRLRIREVRLDERQGNNNKRFLQVMAVADVEDVERSDGTIRRGDKTILLYNADEAGWSREWAEYQLKARDEGYVGPAPEPEVTRVRVNDLVTAYTVTSRQEGFQRPLYIVVEEPGPLQVVALHDPFVLLPGETAVVRLPGQRSPIEVLFDGPGRAHCPDGPHGERGGLCQMVRFRFLVDGRLQAFELYPTSPPTQLIAGISMEEIVLDSIEANQPGAVALSMIDRESWASRWDTGPQDSFSYGCGGGVTGGFSRTQILGDGRIIETASPTFSLDSLNASVETGQAAIANAIFELLDSVELDAQVAAYKPSNYSCSYEVIRDGQSLQINSDATAAAEIKAVLEEAGDILMDKNRRVMTGL